MTAARDTGAIALAERIIAVLDEGKKSTTYKLALLAALMDLCLESADRDGEVRDTFTTRQVAEKVIELYWPHSLGYSLRGETARVLSQSATGRAEIVTAIAGFRESVPTDPGAPIARARRVSPDGWERLVREVEWKLIQMPLPRLQRLGQDADPFLFEIGWTEEIARRSVTAYQSGMSSDFDNRVRLRPAVGDDLCRLHGLLRPLLHRKWVEKVVALNDLDEQRVEEFLFGATRVDLIPVRADLIELADGRCFYCDSRLAAATDVDHFVPWSRHPENAIENLVPAHRGCNGQKSDHLAARAHVIRWRERMERGRGDLRSIAARHGFDTAAERALNVARGIYVRLPQKVRLWTRKGEFEPIGREPIAPLFRPLTAA